MKLYRKKPSSLIRVNLIQEGYATKHLSFYNCDLFECSSSISASLDALSIGENKITIQSREWLGGKNGKSVSFTLNTSHDVSGIEDLLVIHFG